MAAVQMYLPIVVVSFLVAISSGRISTALLSGAASTRGLAEDTQQAPSPSHIILTPGQPVAAITPIAERHAKQQQLPVFALDCPQCVHISHRSYHGLIRSALDRFNSPTCGYNNVTIGTQHNNARLVKCDRPGERAEYKCGLIRGRASVKVDGQQVRDPDIHIDLAVRMCIEVAEDSDDTYCEEDDGIQREYLRQALTYYPDRIPINPSNVKSYQGETCFCSDNQCISGACSLSMAAILMTSLLFLWSAAILSR